MSTGFGNHHESEALPGALPIGQNSPKICPYNLYAEQINGTAFTAPRASNQRTWMYRLKPSVGHKPFKAYTKNLFLSTKELINLPNQLRWDPFELPEASNPRDFVDGLTLIASAGSPITRNGLNILIYTFNSAMENRAFYNSDVPQLNGLRIKTEMGILQIEINEICVIPRGIVFQIEGLNSDQPYARGYILEIFSGHFELPDLGPIGANGLANPQDFIYPQAEFDQHQHQQKDKDLNHHLVGNDTEWNIITKYGNDLFIFDRIGSPFNVVAWRGNYAPFKYNLNKFNVINSVSWDHPDPSIFTVLTCKGSTNSFPLADFVIFPPRWQVSEHTFRPPYFHRNAMSEFMGLIVGDYEAKKDGFLPGGASLHSIMTPHGPDAVTFKSATVDSPQLPLRVADGTMAFMFESSLMLAVTPWALKKVQQNYTQVWEKLS